MKDMMGYGTRCRMLKIFTLKIHASFNQTTADWYAKHFQEVNDILIINDKFRNFFKIQAFLSKKTKGYL